ncbi:Striatin-3 [Rhizophlyctis rosea]|uniref:Striatin-3 n=1 Tax=Rhizophlyctis rosea TaxID=64517 RepID=A0AAD5X557_9FUNG|nr:Striatin-3 [Rhizophlyctis rosea]
MLEFALRQERSKYLSLQQQQSAGQKDGSPIAAEGTNAPAQPAVDAKGSLNPTSIPDSALPPLSQFGTIGSGGTLLNFSKGFGHARSREILKNYLREVGYLLSTTGSAQNSIRIPNNSTDESEALDVADGPTSLLKREPTITANRARASPGGPGSRPREATKGPTLASKLSPDSAKPAPVPVKPKEDTESRAVPEESKGGGKADVGERSQQDVGGVELGEKPERPPRRAKRTQDDVDEEKPSPNEEPMSLDQVSEHLNLPADKVSRLMSKWEGKSGTGKKAAVAAASAVQADQKQKTTIPSVVANALAVGESDVLAALSLTEDDVDESSTLKRTSGIGKSAEQKLWKPKTTLRSHLDSVRSIVFHPAENVLLSASEDNTTKVWNLAGTDNRNGKGPIDVEPIDTLRGHTGPVTSVVVSADGDWCYTGSTDATIRVWKMPSLTKEKYDNYDSSLKKHTFVGHSDIIWDLKSHPLPQQFPILASASGDGTVKLWDVTSGSFGLKSTIRYGGTVDGGESNGGGGEGDGELLSPTSLDWVHTGLNRIVVAYRNSVVKVFDMETGREVLRCKSGETFDGTTATQINRVVCHPTLPLIITAHEDRFIRLFDVNTGECTHSQIGHLDGVTTLDIAPGGLTMASGGHDCSIRWWDLGTRSCVQEYTSHRKKNDEGVWSVKYHPMLQETMASGGADGLCKIYNFGTGNG